MDFSVPHPTHRAKTHSTRQSVRMVRYPHIRRILTTRSSSHQRYLLWCNRRIWNHFATLLTSRPRTARMHLFCLEFQPRSLRGVALCLGVDKADRGFTESSPAVSFSSVSPSPG